MISKDKQFLFFIRHPPKYNFKGVICNNLITLISDRVINVIFPAQVYVYVKT